MTVHDLAKKRFESACEGAAMYQNHAASLFAAWDSLDPLQRELLGPYVLPVVSRAYDKARYWMAVAFHHQGLML